MKEVADASGLASSQDFIAPVRILDAQGKIVRVISADEFRRTHPKIAAGRDFPTAGRRPRSGKMKGLVAGVATLILATIAPPAMAYMAVITTSVVVANGTDGAELQSAVESAVTDVLRRAIAFSPTIVTLEKATLVGNRLYLVLFLTDEDGGTSVSTLPGLVPPREDPTDSPEKAPRTTM
jgi:hypothetical protein